MRKSNDVEVEIVRLTVICWYTYVLSDVSGVYFPDNTGSGSERPKCQACVTQ